MLRPLALLLVFATASAAGCVKRTITITSDPSGALVWVNDREIGRTPVDTGFLHYGTYDVRLVKSGYDPLLTVGEAKAPLWDIAGPDLVAELLPFEIDSVVEWHFELQPLPADENVLRDDAVRRARELREHAVQDDADAETP